MDVVPSQSVFYFYSFDLPQSFGGTWPVSICVAYNALQGLQAVALMLCKLTFQLSDKVVAVQ